MSKISGQLSADDRNRIGAISRKALRRGVTHTAFDIEEIIDSAIIANFLPVLPNPVTVYIISFLLKPLHTAPIVSRKDNILTNSLKSSS